MYKILTIYKFLSMILSNVVINVNKISQQLWANVNNYKQIFEIYYEFTNKHLLTKLNKC